MATVFILDFDGATTAQYDRAMELLRLDGRLPANGLLHACGATATGLRVVNIWKDTASFADFAENALGHYAAKVGITQDPRIDLIDIVERRAAGPAPVSFLHVVRLPVGVSGFRALDEAVGGHVLPAGCVYHVNGPQIDGRWAAVSTWTSRAARDAFLEANMTKAMKEARLDEPLVFEELDLHHALAVWEDVRSDP